MYFLFIRDTSSEIMDLKHLLFIICFIKLLHEDCLENRKISIKSL